MMELTRDVLVSMRRCAMLHWDVCRCAHAISTVNISKAGLEAAALDAGHETSSLSCVPLKPVSINRDNLPLLLRKLKVLTLVSNSSACVQQCQDQLVWFTFSILLNKSLFSSVHISYMNFTSISTNYHCVGRLVLPCALFF